MYLRKQLVGTRRPLQEEEEEEEEPKPERNPQASFETCTELVSTLLASFSVVVVVVVADVVVPVVFRAAGSDWMTVKKRNKLRVGCYSQLASQLAATLPAIDREQNVHGCVMTKPFLQEQA